MFANDLSLSLKSETFSALKEDFDSILARTIGNMEMKGAEEATVTLKLGISLEKSSVNSPSGLQEITKPSFKHDISSVMQVKDKKSGALTGDYELVWDAAEGKYVMRRIDNGQVSIFDSAQTAGDVIDADYTALPEGQRGLPEASQNDEEAGDTSDTDEAENTEPDSANESVNTPDDTSTPFGWLKQFAGMDMRVTEAMGNYTVRTAENKIVLSSATSETSPFYCPAEKLAPHVGHKVSCVGYGDENGAIVNVSVECEDCNEVLFELSAPGVVEMTDEEIAASVNEEGPGNYDYETPESDKEAE